MARAKIRHQRHDTAFGKGRRARGASQGRAVAMPPLALGSRRGLARFFVTAGPMTMPDAVRTAVPEVHHNLGNILREKGRLDEALAAYTEALRLRPDYAKAYINRGVALVSLARLDEAVADLRHGVELWPDLADAHNSLGSALSV